ncbi:MAG: hypothetical protein KDG89_11680 [Geminicoccaceae bacterium]|nr:hypothetical protein [Geminicoccaceae bacterium]
MDIIDQLGGVSAVARALGVGHSAVSNWRAGKFPDGAKYQVLVLARQKGLDISPEDLEKPLVHRPRVVRRPRAARAEARA